MEKKTFNSIIAIEIIGFLCMLLIVWLNELLDLPSTFMGGQETPVNYYESTFETILIFFLAVGIIFLTWDILQKLKSFQAELEKTKNQLEIKVKERTYELELRNRQLKELTRKTIETLENDRKLTAKEIHDSIGGSLAAIKMLLETRIASMPQAQPESIISLEAIVGHLADVLEECKRISHQMRPIALDNLGLGAAISESIETFNQFYPGITLDKQIDISPDQFTDEIKTAVYRTIQEALNNIGKHSRADHVEIELTECEDHLRLMINDNGIGFDVSSNIDAGQPLRGYGLLNMKERVEICRGNFELKSSPGKGTRLFASIPRNL